MERRGDDSPLESDMHDHIALGIFPLDTIQRPCIFDIRFGFGIRYQFKFDIDLRYQISNSICILYSSGNYAIWW
jgi:hypothetical protein